MAQKKALGKGLAALITQPDAPHDAERGGVIEADVRRIEPNRQQPRKFFGEESLNELAESIRQHGVIQPLIVKQEEGGYYSIIAGERRYRAARAAKLDTVPVIVKDYGESETLQIALIENIQRQDLNPIEEASCFKRLADEYFFTREDIAAKINKSRGYVSNALGLLNLDRRVQDLLAEERLTASQARVLLKVTDAGKQFFYAEKAVTNGLSAAELEALIERETRAVETKKNAAPVLRKYRYIEDDLKSILGTKVNIKDGKNKGRIEIEYYSAEELDRLLGLFKSL